MAEQSTGQWEALRERIVDTPELRERYDRTRAAVIQTRELLQQIDSERELAGLTKAALAERIGVDASVVRRLFSAEARNPTLRTVLEMADALGMQISIRPSRRRPQLRRGQRVTRAATSTRREAVPS
jgi:ribosome-binding protein aMBF1 (putative translation factor)